MKRVTLSDRVFEALVEDEDARVCRDIPEDACTDQPRAFTLQLGAQVLTKLGDALTSSRLVLAWMLSSLGAPAFFVAMLVPVRESLSLLPQLFIAQAVRQRALRKGFWVWGSIGQGMALAGMVLVVLLLEGFALGVGVIALLALFSLARGVCSVAAKDVLGKTVAKGRRGRLTGLSAAISGAITLGVAVSLMLAPALFGGGKSIDEPGFFAALLGLSAGLWLVAALVYARIPEVAGSTSGGGNAFSEAVASIGLLRTDRDLRQFVVARMLLVATAFAIPYLVVLIQRNAGGHGLGLAALLFAEGAAGLLSGPLWGRWSDSQSQRVMAAAAALSGMLMIAVLLLDAFRSDWLGVPWLSGGLLFIAAVAHHGARVGRKTYLVDMANADNRAQYTAVSNTVIGIFLLGGAALGWLDAQFGTGAVLALLAVVAGIAVWRALSLRPVA